MFIALQFLFVVSNTVANMLPRETIAEHAQQSLNSELITNKYEYDHRVLGGTVSYDNNRFILEIAVQSDKGSPFATMAVADIVDFNKDGSQTSMQYFRYWHGWQLLTNLCLLAGTIDLVQFPVFVISLIGASLFWLALSRHIGKLRSAIYSAILLLSTNLLFNFMADLLLSISFFTFLGLLSIGWLLWQKKSLSSELGILWTFGVGCVYSFLDFLTIPAVAVGIVATAGIISCGGVV